jgi:hypothetical protein
MVLQIIWRGDFELSVQGLTIVASAIASLPNIRSMS